MSNSYFNFTTGRMVAGENALAEDVNAGFDAVAAGFDKLPTPDATKFLAGAHNTTSGSAGNFVLEVTADSYFDGMAVSFKANHSNSGACTLNVGSLGAKQLVDGNGSALVAGDIVANSIYAARYNSTSDKFHLVGVASAAKLPNANAAGANKLVVTNSTGNGWVYPAISAAALGLLDDATVGAMLTTLGGAPLASPLFTGDPRAPTRDVLSDSTSIATTAFVKLALVAPFISSLNNPGWVVIPLASATANLMIQWGLVTTHATANTAATHSFPVAFNGLLGIAGVPVAIASTVVNFAAITDTGFNTYSNVSSANARYIAVGYIHK